MELPKTEDDDVEGRKALYFAKAADQVYWYFPSDSSFSFTGRLVAISYDAYIPFSSCVRGCGSHDRMQFQYLLPCPHEWKCLPHDQFTCKGFRRGGHIISEVRVATLGTYRIFHGRTISRLILRYRQSIIGASRCIMSLGSPEAHGYRPNPQDFHCSGSTGTRTICKIPEFLPRCL